MKFALEGSNIAVIGGEASCKKLLEILFSPNFKNRDINITAVADKNSRAPGMVYAKKRGVFTTTDYRDIYTLEKLDRIINFTQTDLLSKSSEKPIPENVKIIDHVNAMLLLDEVQLEEEKIEAKKRLLDDLPDCRGIDEIFDHFSDRILKTVENRTRHLQEAEDDLAESEKELSQIIQGSMIPIFIINQDHIVTHWNRACEKLTGYPAYGIVGTDKQWTPFRSEKRPTMADVLLIGMDEEKVNQYYGNLWRKSEVIEGAFEAEEFFEHLGENGKWIYFTAAPIKSPEGNVIGAIETLWDKTETKKVERERELKNKEIAFLYEKYKKSEEKYRSLFNNNPNPIFIIDSETFEIMDVNSRVEEKYGYRKKELFGVSFLEMGEREDEVIARGLKEISKEKSILFSKKRHYKKDGSSIFVNINVCYAKYSLKDVLIASATDITESIEKETQLIQAGKMATLGTMAAGMAHEINQPLNVIQICADLFLKMVKKGQTVSNEDLEEMANDISANVSRAADVIKHVRDFARQSEKNLKKIKLNEPINDVFKVLGHQLSVHNIEVERILAPDLSDIRAEHNRLEQVFINLVNNAIDAMDEKAEKAASNNVEKKLKIETYNENGFVVAKVSDTGVGISDDVKEKLFEPFFTTKETGKGTGLGNSISYGIIKDYGGTIDVESREGEGAVFTIKFPVYQKDPEN